MEICIRWGFKESVHLSLSILPIQQSIDKYFEPQSLFSRHQQGSRMVSAGISIALCNKRSCVFTWKQCLIFMRMTALHKYRTLTWPSSDSIKSICQAEQNTNLKLLFWKVWLLNLVMCHQRSSAAVAVEQWGDSWLLQQTLGHPGCMWIITELDELIILSVRFRKNGQKFNWLQPCSDPLRQWWVWILGFKTISCFKAWRWQSHFRWSDPNGQLSKFNTCGFSRKWHIPQAPGRSEESETRQSHRTS